MEEIWKDIKGWEGLYQVSNLGRVKRLADKFYVKDPYWNREYYKTINEKIIKQHVGNLGYMELQLTNPHTKKVIMIRTHILIAQAFVPNPENKTVVNHIDGNKLNNSVKNLEWVTNYENIQHAISTGLTNNKKAILQLDKNTNKIINMFESAKDAEIELNIKNLSKNMAHYIRNNSNGYGYKWRYLD